jgi:hypothetical protein
MGAIAVLTFGLGLFAVVAAIPVTFWLGLLVVGASAGPRSHGRRCADDNHATRIIRPGHAGHNPTCTTIDLALCRGLATNGLAGPGG